MYFLFKVLPTNLVSFVTGLIFRIKFPWPLSYIVCKVFALIIKVDLQEAEKSIHEYRSIEDLFTRKLRANSRIIQEPICSPSDGYVFCSDFVNQMSSVQAKGMNYNINELLCGSCNGLISRNFEPGWCFSIYLAPHNYHRVHSPLNGFLKSITYIPGKLWPVNRYFSQIVPKLFVQNERVVLEIAHKVGTLYLVMIGAFNVGRIFLNSYSSLITNSFKRQFNGKIKYKLIKPHQQLSIGDEIGMFCLGSTVVLIFDQNFCNEYKFIQVTSDKYPIKLGEKIVY